MKYRLKEIFIVKWRNERRWLIQCKILWWWHTIYEFVDKENGRMEIPDYYERFAKKLYYKITHR